MEQCALTEGCIFFNDKMANMPKMAELYKDKYCGGGGYNECARYRVFAALGRENVPADLYPNDADRASALISA